MNYPINTLDQLRPILVGFRKSRKLTQAALADKLGITQQTYAQLEANPSSASVERVFKVLQLLGVQWVLGDGAVAAIQDKSQYIAAVAESSTPYAVDVSARSADRQATSKSTTPKRASSGTKKKESW